jgi:hypothetical protein
MPWDMDVYCERPEGPTERVYTQEWAPLDWAKTQNNLGNALSQLRKRESGTGRLEEALSAHRESLREYTRDRVPLLWAATQNNLGNTLGRLGGARERDSSSGRGTRGVGIGLACLSGGWD